MAPDAGAAPSPPASGGALSAAFAPPVNSTARWRAFRIPGRYDFLKASCPLTLSSLVSFLLADLLADVLVNLLVDLTLLDIFPVDVLDFLPVDLLLVDFLRVDLLLVDFLPIDCLVNTPFLERLDLLFVLFFRKERPLRDGNFPLLLRERFLLGVFFLTIYNN